MKRIEQLLRDLEDRPNDPEVLGRLGEHFQKQGDNKSAAKHFASIAEIYDRDGFQLKAIALYKAVLNLDVERIEVLACLAKLHASLNLDAEANAYFLKARDAFLRVGRRSDALEMERKLKERNVTIYPGPTGHA